MRPNIIVYMLRYNKWRLFYYIYVCGATVENERRRFGGLRVKTKFIFLFTLIYHSQNVYVENVGMNVCIEYLHKF